jgi:hypothetical protein
MENKYQSFYFFVVGVLQAKNVDAETKISIIEEELKK